jgi:hypothetical protein
MARARIRCGQLPATRVGRAYLVDPLDVAMWLAPRTLPTVERPRRESSAQRDARQLAAAGFAPGVRS